MRTSSSLDIFFLVLYALGSNCGSCLLSLSAASANFKICDSIRKGVSCNDELPLLPGLELEEGGQDGASKGE